MARACYLYGIVGGDGPRSLGRVGVGEPPAEVRVLAEGGLGALVSVIDTDTPLSVVRDTRVHQRVLERVLEDGAVLPVSFGTAADSEQAVRTLLRAHREEFTRLLSELEGKVEAGVKAFWEKDAVISELAPRWGSVEDLRRRAAEDEKLAARLSVSVGQAVAEVLERWKSHDIPRIQKRLEREALASRYSDPIGIRMIMNASYLVRRDRLPAFERLVYEIDKEYGSRMRFHLVAPLPAYNFVDLRLGPEEVKRLGGR